MAINQISIFLENRAGQLAEVTRVLGDNGIDMRAISIAETADYGVLRIIVDDADKATSILLSKGQHLSKNACLTSSLTTYIFVEPADVKLPIPFVPVTGLSATEVLEFTEASNESVLKKLTSSART